MPSDLGVQRILNKQQPQQGQQQANPLDRLAEILTDRVMRDLEGPEPVAPQPNIPQLSGLQSAAAAMNPQYADLIYKQAQAPGQAKFAAEQAMFERAMQQRQQSSQLAGQLISTQSTQAQRDIENQAEQDRLTETGRHNLAMEGRPRGARTRTVYSPQGYAFTQDLDTNEVTPINLPGGGQAAKPISGAVTAKVGTLKSIRAKAENINNRLISVYSSHDPRIRMAVQAAQSFPGGPTLTGYAAPELQKVTADLKDLNDFLLRLRSGAQINEQEYERLSNTMPQIGENPEVAASKMARFFRELDDIQSAYEQTQPIGNVFSPSHLQGLSDQELLDQINAPEQE